MCVDQNFKEHLWTTPVWKARKWIPTKEISTPWILWGETHSRNMEAHLTPNTIHPGSRWFWCEIHQTKRRGTPVGDIKKRIHHSINWLGQCAILRNHVVVELRGKMAGHLHARVCLKIASKIHAWNTPTTATLTICHRPEKYGKDAHDPLPPEEPPPVS